MQIRVPPAAINQGRSQSAQHFNRAKSVLPGGVTRATVEVTPHPLYMRAGQGAYLTDEDGRQYLDLNNNYTTLIHGHSFEPVCEAVLAQLRHGACFANPTTLEIDLAQLLVERIPAAEQIRFVNTGSEAVMFAIKAARTFTGRPAIARFDGCYHGSYDWVETPRPGTPAYVATDVVLLDFNSIDETIERIRAQADRLAAILIDPMPSRAGLLPPDSAFLAAINTMARQHGILVIADEVLNFRQDFSGASARYGLKPDLITLGKIIGGGFPIGAVCGRKIVMSVFGDIAKPARLPQSGTFSGNPISMVAGFAAMTAMDRDAFTRLEALGDDLRTRLSNVIAAHGADFSVTGASSLFRIHARAQAPSTYAQARPSQQQADTLRRLTEHFKAHDIMLPFGAAACLSTAMGQTEVNDIVSAFETFVSDPSETSEA